MTIRVLCNLMICLFTLIFGASSTSFGFGFNLGFWKKSGSPPAAPTSLAVTNATTSQVSLSWVDNSSNETGFKIDRSSDGTNWTNVTTTAANAVTYANSSLAQTTKYYYRVYAINGSGNSTYSNTVNVTTGPPPNPTNLTAPEVDDCWSIGNGNGLVSWTSGGGTTTYFKWVTTWNGGPAMGANCTGGNYSGTTSQTSMYQGGGIYIQICAVDAFGNVSSGVTVYQGYLFCWD